MAAPPPADAFPFLDMTHLLSIVFGPMAAFTTWRELKRRRTAWNWAWGGVAVLPMIGLFVVHAALSRPNL